MGITQAAYTAIEGATVSLDPAPSGEIHMKIEAENSGVVTINEVFYSM
jgi:hypothetical protein